MYILVVSNLFIIHVYFLDQIFLFVLWYLWDTMVPLLEMKKELCYVVELMVLLLVCDLI